MGCGGKRASAPIARYQAVLTTDDFHMRGPSAQVNMKGTVDLVRETQDLNLRVVPSLGDAASLYAVLINPACPSKVRAALVRGTSKNSRGQRLLSQECN